MGPSELGGGAHQDTPAKKVIGHATGGGPQEKTVGVAHGGNEQDARALGGLVGKDAEVINFASRTSRARARTPLSQVSLA